MFKQNEHTESMSTMVSQVLSDIGVNEKMVLKRRKAWLLNESLENKTRKLFGIDAMVYFLGSQSEGATTRGLASDVDALTCLTFFNVIDDVNDWEQGFYHFLMIQEEREEQGYCKLQLLQDDKPLPYPDVPSVYFCKMNKTGKVLLRNTTASSLAESLDSKGGFRHGPAYSLEKPGFQDKDNVIAFPLKSWPREARPWLDKRSQWPTQEMKNYCSRTVCFVVGVGRKDSENEDVEWRISTSLAERCLMFNLNITQLRCYVLMKFILKQFIKPSIGETISSYMCKTILFHCIANTEQNMHSEVWSERNILICFTKCLFVLYTCIHCEKCSHFISPKNNLMKGKILAESKPDLLKTLESIIKSNGAVLQQIDLDGFGLKLQIQMGCSIYGGYKPTLNQIISGYLIKTTAGFIDVSIWALLNRLSKTSNEEIIQTLQKLISLSVNDGGQGLEKKANCILASKLSETLGYALASLNIQAQKAVSEKALSWISLNLNTDVASSKLKLASMFYCTGEYIKAETILRGIEEDNDLECVEEVCHCYPFELQPPSRKFDDISYLHDEKKAIQTLVVFCVKFFRNEKNCAPREMKYEMFRSTNDDLRQREITDFWMDSAVIDSLLYLYYLQYKVSEKLDRKADKQRALSRFLDTLGKRPNLKHRETALNLLGQLMEEQGLISYAIHYYLQSLRLRKRNNVANIHICKLISKLVNNE